MIIYGIKIAKRKEESVQIDGFIRKTKLRKLKDVEKRRYQNVIANEKKSRKDII